MEIKKELRLFTILSLLAGTVFGAISPDHLLDKARAALSRGELDSAKTYSFRAYEQARAAGNDSLEAAASYWVANAFQESQNYSVASTYYQRAIEKADLHDFVPLHARALTTYGAMLATINELNLAKTNIQLSLKIAGQINDPQLMAGNYIHLSHLASMEGDFAAQMKNAALALDLGRELKDTVLIAMAHMNMGSAAWSMNDHAAAEKHQRASAQYFLTIGNMDKFGQAYLDLIHLTKDRGAPFNWKKEAMAFRKLAREKSLDIPDKYFHDLMNMFYEDVNSLEKTQSLLLSILFVSIGIFVVIVLWLIRFVVRAQNNTNVKIEITLEDRIRPLYGPKDNMLVVTYALLASGMSVSKIAETVHKDRTTVYHWIKEIELKLGVENAREDARKHGFSAHKKAQLTRNINPN